MIQIINYQKAYPSFIDKKNITISTLDSPQSLDEFDINIIDLQSDAIWVNNDSNTLTINIINDFISLKSMLLNCTKSVIIIIFPMDYIFDYSKINNQYFDSARLKHILDNLYENILSQLIPYSYEYYNVLFEPTKTTIDNYVFNADFYFCNLYENLTVSDKSDKPTTIYLNEYTKIALTTLNILKNYDSLVAYLRNIDLLDKKEEIPVWLKEFSAFDDDKQKKIISENKEIIEKSELEIENAKNILDENSRYKSILYTNSNALVEVVFDILEKILDYNLSNFIDERKEDFLVKKESVTFVGEIKGVTSNIRSEHISQVDVHYYTYKDHLDENNNTENVKQILIMNSFRSTPINERKEVHQSQIDLAIRNDCLIIKTITLLKLFEKFINSEIDSSKIIELFTNKNGLLKETDF